MMYAQDYDERYPHYRYEVPTAISLYWCPSGTNEGMIGPYIKNRQVFTCPSATSLTYSYGWNYNYLGWAGRGGTDSNAAGAMSEVTHPAETIVVAETQRDQVVSYAPRNESFRTGYTLVYNAPFRHNEGSNYTFADGHSKWLMGNETTSVPSNAKYWTAKR